MIALRILANSIVLVAELAAIAAVSWLAWQYPFAFALATGLLSLALGLTLEYARLANEYSFYFGRALGARSIVAATYAAGEAIVKGLLAGLAVRPFPAQRKLAAAIDDDLRGARTSVGGDRA